MQDAPLLLTHSWLQSSAQAYLMLDRWPAASLPLPRFASYGLEVGSSPRRLAPVVRNTHACRICAVACMAPFETPISQLGPLTIAVSRLTIMQEHDQSPAVTVASARHLTVISAHSQSKLH